MNEVPWYQRNIVVILALGLLFPVGLYLMWRYARWHLAIKVAVSAFFVSALVVVPFDDDFTPNDARDGTVVSTSRPSLSPDQTDLVDELGQPDGFIIAFDVIGNQNIRKEVWSYYGLGAAFIFRDGKYISMASDLPALPRDAVMPTAGPAQFGVWETPASVAGQAGEPLAEARVNPKLVRDSEVYYYRGGLSVVFTGGRVSYVQASPYRPPKAAQAGEAGR